MLSTKNLKKHFDGVKAVHNLSLDFAPGQITGIIGPNGSGKSTLVNLLTGVMPFDDGAVYIGDKLKLDRLQAYDVAEYGITRTFQDVRLFEQMTVLDNLLVVLTERNIFSAFFERHKKFHLDEDERLLRQIGLWDKRDALAVNLSYGQRKLLEVARALAMPADIYFFDEPFAGLFTEMVKIVSGVLRELKMAGKTVVLIEHNMDLIRELSDTVVVLDAGELLAAGKPYEVLSKREVVEAYLGE
ncbi:MAG: ABC transporter ATP-binding protein [Patescibacteria group bacterium]